MRRRVLRPRTPYFGFGRVRHTYEFCLMMARDGISHAMKPPTCAIHPVLLQELRKSLCETREWVEQLLEELEVSQGVVLSLRRELSAAKKRAHPDGERL